MTAAGPLADATMMERVRALNGAFRNTADQWPVLRTALIWVAAGVVFMWIVCRVWTRLQRRGDPAVDPWAFFRTAQRALGLSRLDRWLLTCVARKIRETPPAAMLLSPQLYAEQTRRWLDQHAPAPLREPARTRLQRVAERLFEPRP
jgi:hypothetical protein